VGDLEKGGAFWNMVVKWWVCVGRCSIPPSRQQASPALRVTLERGSKYEPDAACARGQRRFKQRHIAVTRRLRTSICRRWRRCTRAMMECAQRRLVAASSSTSPKEARRQATRESCQRRYITPEGTLYKVAGRALRYLAAANAQQHTGMRHLAVPVQEHGAGWRL
jgi:hypothetical protein